MFKQLKDDALKIDQRIANLERQFKFVVNRYTYHNKDPDKIIAIKEKELKVIRNGYSDYRLAIENFEKLLDNCEQQINEIKVETINIVVKFNLNVKSIEEDNIEAECGLHFNQDQLDDTDFSAIDSNLSTDKSSDSGEANESPEDMHRVLIARHHSINEQPQTPAFKIKPKLNRIDFLKENYN